MRWQKIFAIAALAWLTGCSDHAFEGEYIEQAGSSVEVLNAFAQIAGGRTVVIGPDYLDTDGVRTPFKDIFVRESGSQSYLVFKKDDGSEEVWKIIDKDTLQRGGDLVSITLKRIKKP